MLAGIPIVKYMSISDIALAFLVLEHHMMKWRSLLQFELETGCPPSQEFCRQQSFTGLLYQNGISGEDAKKRFENLCRCFFTNFYTDKCPKRGRNVRKLQALLNEQARNDCNLIKAKINSLGGASTSPSPLQVQEDIIHRVFYYITL